MKSTWNSVFIASYLFLKKGNKILLLRRFNTGFYDGHYTMVSGHIEAGETAEIAMKREAREEAGIEINLESLKVVHIMHRKSPDRTYIDFFLTTDEWKGTPKNMEPNKCDDMRWFDAKDLPDNTIPYIPIAIQKIENSEFYSTYGF